MKTIYKQISLFLITIFLLISCTDVIDVDVPDAGSRLVVEASINWEKGTTGQYQVIKLSTSTAFFNSNTDVPIIGAIVKVIKENDGIEFNFQDQGNGEYVTNNFIPELNQTYALEVIYNEKIYSAIETLISVVDISEVAQTTIGGDEEDAIEVTIYFDDPEDETNYYLGEFISSQEPLPILEPLDDSFTNGNQNFMEFESEDFETGSTLDVNLYGISEQYYNYINLLVRQSSSGGSPFQTTPAQLKGNCKNLKNLDEEVLGYFRLGEVVKISHTIN